MARSIWGCLSFRPPTDSDAVLRDLGCCVAELRTAKGLTQEGFAERAYVSIKYVQRIKGGRANLSVRSLVKLANILGVSVADLFAKPGRPPARPGRPSRRG